MFAGQSNAQSNFTTLAGVPAYIVSDAKGEDVELRHVGVCYLRGWDQFSTAKKHRGSGGGVAGNWGAEAEFSYRYRLANPTKTVFLVKYAIGSTNLYPTAGDDWSETSTGEYFSRVEAAITAAKAAVTALGLTPVVKGLGWMQGEADCGNVTWDAAYPTNLTNLATAMRTRWGDAQTKIVIGRINIVWEINLNVRPAQVSVGNAGPLNEWLDTDNYALTSNHFNDSGASQFGKDAWYYYQVGHSERVVNGAFTSAITPWTGQSRNSGSGNFGPSATVLSLSSGVLLATNGGTDGVC